MSAPHARAGFTRDPAECDGWCAWLRLGSTTLYVYSEGWRVRLMIA